ncbi:hypothetical protein LGH70_19470 [Hymenobacter sp. BT635]|uniref:Phage tail collar domain-containing protein n=1 Tax=Hymenobacter nitidus TaxID=2880929 RepID=A0ABS8AH76_9BACT|nr:hypothetical protein [Hymenobacter nitidus]MCB2379785.1 hypothetical protein [Hymenobacter nitidus]
MQMLQADINGREITNDDLIVPQQEIYTAMSAQFLGNGSFVLEGCKVTPAGPNAYNIGSGIVFLGGQIVRFVGASNQVLPAELVLGPVEAIQERAYADGSSRAGIVEQQALCREASAEPVSKIPVLATGTKTWWHVQQARLRAKSEIQWLAEWNSDDYENGLGKYGTEAYGWARADGNNGTKNIRSRVAVALDAADPDYDTIGKTGGVKTVTLTAAQMPNHVHRQRDSYSPNGPNDGSVTLKGGVKGGEGPAMFQTDPAGGGQAHENRQPFITLAARQWIGL